MEEACFKEYFKVKKLRGNNEIEIYRNYTEDLPKMQIQKFFDVNFAQTKLCTKNDTIALNMRQHSNNSTKQEAFSDALSYLTRSLCYASYNSEAYACALAKRSHNYLELGDFQNCIKDIDLCLKAKYPDILRPTLWLRKAECLKRLGCCAEMKATLLDVLQLVDDMKGLSYEVSEKYKQTIKDMLEGHNVPTIECENACTGLYQVPEMPQHSTFLNASAKLELRYTKRMGRHVVATKKINEGESLFVEKSYSFAPLYNQDGFSNMCSNYCQYCLAEVGNCIPCKKCVTYIYCNEKCRDAAWNEFHRWECLAVQANIFKYIRKAHLPFRIIIKAAHKGFNRVSAVSEFDTSIYGDKTNNYPYVYNSSSNINRLPRHLLMQFAATAALLVNYLKLKTDFFNWLVKQPGCADKEDSVLMEEVGALIIRHCSDLPNKFLTIKSYDSTTLADEKCFPIFTEIASAVCPSVTTMRHSCAPNTSQYFVGDTVVIKALMDISPNQEIFIPYLNINYITMGTQERQESLEKNCFIKCKCLACINPTLDLATYDSLKCIKCEGRAPAVYANKDNGRIEFLCSHCNYKFLLPNESIQQINAYNENWTKFEKTREIKYINHCLTLCTNIYPSTHNVFNKIYWQLLRLHVDEGNLCKAVEMGSNLREFAHRRVIYKTAFECGFQIYLVCTTILEHANSTSAYHIDVQELGDAISTVASFLEEAKLIFELHYPPSISHIQKLELLLETYNSIYKKRLDELELPNMTK